MAKKRIYPFSQKVTTTGKKIKLKLKCLIIEAQTAIIPQGLWSHAEG